MKVRYALVAVLMLVLVGTMALAHSTGSGFTIPPYCLISTYQGDLDFPTTSLVRQANHEGTCASNTLELSIQHNGDVELAATCDPFTLSAPGYSYDGYKLYTKLHFKVEGSSQEGGSVSAAISLSGGVSFGLTGGDARAEVYLEVSRTGYADPRGPYSTTVTVTCSAI